MTNSPALSGDYFASLRSQLADLPRRSGDDNSRDVFWREVADIADNAGLSVDQVASALEVHPKTVTRGFTKSGVAVSRGHVVR